MFFVRRDVGEPGKKMVDHLISYAVRNGWEAGPDLWDEMPIPVIVKVVGNERFFVPNEYYRAIFIIKLIERRMELAPEKRDERGILMLRDLLNNQVIYNHIAFPKLRELQQYRDLDGEPYIAKDTILQAIWSAIDLRDQIQISKVERLNYSSYFSHKPKKNTGSYFETDPGIINLLREIDDLLADKEQTEAVVKSELTPFRISFTFDGLSTLKEGNYLRSKSFFYAGSYWILAFFRNPGGVLSLVITRAIGKANAIDFQEFLEGPIIENVYNKDRCMSLPKQYAKNKNQPEIKLWVPNPKIDYDFDTCLDTKDERQSVDYYASVHFCVGNNRNGLNLTRRFTSGKMESSAEGGVGFSNLFRTKAYGSKGNLREEFEPFKVSLVLGLL
ncbi:unnamed protein product [Ambrosiozyma monospora]|uniref:Unnamed protein product n=1 Tax=Ambrosiozyma monospora TaxID=43982 RepID=A0A9W7DJA9_AMBMO|nr:unnamed protein product [Ambrosiozyma monospora]